MVMLLVTSMGCSTAPSASSPVTATWERTDALSISDVKLGEDVGPDQTTQSSFMVTVEQTTIPLSLDVRHGRTMTTSTKDFPSLVQVPRRLQLTVEPSDGWTVKASFEDAIAVGLPKSGLSYGEEPDLWQSVALRFQKRSREHLLLLEVRSNGQATLMSNTVTTQPLGDPATTVQDTLTILPLSLYAGDQLMIRVNARGAVESSVLGGEPEAVGWVYEEGILLTRTEPGRVMSLDPDGTLRLANATESRPLGMTVSTTGVVTRQKATYAFDEKGIWTGPDTPKPPIRAEGLAPQTRRLGAFLVASMMSGLKSSQPETTDENATGG